MLAVVPTYNNKHQRGISGSMKPRYTDAFWGEHPFDGEMILIKNKNKNKRSIFW